MVNQCVDVSLGGLDTSHGAALQDNVKECLQVDNDKGTLDFLAYFHKMLLLKVTQ